MFSKEECEKALLILKQEYDSNPYVIVLFEDLINEHFELVEEYKDTRKELDCYYEMMSNPQPYKFEDLKEEMFVYEINLDNIYLIYYTTENIKTGARYIYGYGCGDSCLTQLKFEENRFFPVQMANVNEVYRR